MFDQSKLADALVAYKQNFVSKQWGDEKYKWEAIRWFQDNWDVNAQDFADMLSRSLDKTYNLLASMNKHRKKFVPCFLRSLMRAKMYMRELTLSRCSPPYCLKSMEMALVNIISTKMPSAHICGCGILTSITSISLPRLKPLRMS